MGCTTSVTSVTSTRNKKGIQNSGFWMPFFCLQTSQKRCPDKTDIENTYYTDLHIPTCCTTPVTQSAGGGGGGSHRSVCGVWL